MSYLQKGHWAGTTDVASLLSTYKIISQILCCLLSPHTERFVETTSSHITSLRQIDRHQLWQIMHENGFPQAYFWTTGLTGWRTFRQRSKLRVSLMSLKPSQKQQLEDREGV
uniref:(northern house mosquito) hypothetical protein n=1 Tax=Culex pipiens TaxID=7175 RepID=A0A8D8CN66_CULPI